MMWVDITSAEGEEPKPGWFLQAIGRRGDRNSAYIILSTRLVRRRDPRAFRRIAMDVEVVDEIPAGAKVFEFRWYPRKKKRRMNFEQFISRRV